MANFHLVCDSTDKPLIAFAELADAQQWQQLEGPSNSYVRSMGTWSSYQVWFDMMRAPRSAS